MAQQIPGFTPDPVEEGFTPDTTPEPVVTAPVKSGAPVLTPEPRPSFLSRAWQAVNTPLIPVTEPTMEEWVKSPSWSATRSGLAQATTPLALGSELLGGVGLLKGIRKIRGKVPAIAQEATEVKPKFDPNTGEIFEAAPSVKPPMFNPKGRTGLTGQEQLAKFQIPENVQKITIKKDAAKMLPLAKEQGFIPGGVTPEGFPIMIRGKKAEPIVRKIKDIEPPQAGAIREAWNLARGTMSVDLPFITSAGFRQALPLVGTKAWFKAWAPSIKSFGSKTAFEAHDALIRADPLLERPVVPRLGKDGLPRFDKNGAQLMKETPSILERAGVVLPDVKSLTTREEAIRSQLAERIPVWGKYVAASNRAYTAYLKDLRVNAFRNMYEAMPDKNNLVHLKQLGDAVNTFTGRGPLRTKIPLIGGKQLPILGKVPEEISAERHAEGLAEILFSPRLTASRMQLLNPVNYTMTAPQVRKEYLKALLRTAGAWTTFASLGSMMGANVSLDPRSADFGKIRIGNARLDPAGGFQQFLVLSTRLATNEFTSSTSGRTYDLGRGGPYGQTRGSVATNFALNKLHPMVRYFIDAAYASKDQPFHVFDRAAQMMVPMLSLDLMEIAQEEPELVPLLAPLASAGFGTQYYEKGEDFSKSQILPEGFDVTLGR